MPLTARSHPEIMDEFFSRARPAMYTKGEIIVEGERLPERTYYIKSGYVKGYNIRDDGTCSLSIIKAAGDLIPLASLFSSSDNVLYYEAMTDVVVHSVAKPVFEMALAERPELALATLQKSLAVLRDYTQRLSNLEIADARQRIICRLLFLRQRFGGRSVRGREVIFAPVTYPDLADSLNLTRETVNRLVRELVAEGMVAKSRGSLTITDKNRLLQEVAGVYSFPQSD